MNYFDKYNKYKTKYLELVNSQMVKWGGAKKNIILFPDLLTNKQYPKHFLKKIKNYNITTFNYLFNEPYKTKFNLSNLQFENVAKYVYNLIDPTKKYIVFGLNQGCALASYFSNKYNGNVVMQILINNRRMNKKNYEKSIVRWKRMLEIEYDKATANIAVRLAKNKYCFVNKYKYGIQTDADLHKKIKNKKDILVYGTIMLNIRAQYKKVPVKQKIKTYIFDQMVTDKKIMHSHNLKDKKTRKIKDLHTIDQAMLDHYKTNMDKVIQNNNMINNSAIGMVMVDYALDILEGEIITKNRMQKIMHILNNNLNNNLDK